MANTTSGKKGSILSKISLDRFASVVASLGDRIEQLRKETWRLNSKTQVSSSLWKEVTDELELTHDEKTRHALYHLLRSAAHGTSKLIEEKRTSNQGEKDEDDLGTRIDTDRRPARKNDSTLLPVPSLPLPKRPVTRATQQEDADKNDASNSIINDTSFVFNPIEWKDVFSATHQKMKKDWTDIFYKKMTALGIKCPVKFKTPYIKKGKRKRNCRFFCCVASCTLGICTRTYQIILRNQPDESSSVLFLVRIIGYEQHDANVEIAGRQVRAQFRSLIGKGLHDSLSEF